MYYEAIHFLIFTGGEGFQLGNAFEFVRIIIGVFYFLLPLPTPENSEIKVTVKLTGSTVVVLFLYFFCSFDMFIEIDSVSST